MSPKSMKYRQLKLFTFSNDMQMHSFINTFHISKVGCKWNENMLYLLAMKVFNLSIFSSRIFDVVINFQSGSSLCKVKVRQGQMEELNIYVCGEG